MTTKRKIFIAVVVVMTFWFGGDFAWNWNCKRKVINYIGHGKVTDFRQWSVGLDGGRYYRVKCSPAKVKEHLSNVMSEAYSNSHMALTEHFKNSIFIWPEDIGRFEHDWNSYTITPGYYRIIAYPDDTSDEIVVLEYTI